jgi:16S rRNA A1518/A1519 N6-dimethyltransferase RsmA/KsgA/DIM1 with predicted DNA glycosylase/AP lyase activity
MELATRFTQWLMKRLDCYLQGVVLEVGAGIGNNIRALLHKDRIIATEPDPEYVRLLQNAFGGRGNVEVRQWDVTKQWGVPKQASDPSRNDNVAPLCERVLREWGDREIPRSQIGATSA